jgi:sodium:sulfate symporter-like transmembrane protein
VTRIVVIVVAFFVAHYMFASLTAHTTALLPALLAVVAASPELPVQTVSRLLCYTLGLMGVLTPYATGSAPISYASGYVTRREFWTLGAIFGAVYLATLLGVGLPYLTALTQQAASAWAGPAPRYSRPAHTPPATSTCLRGAARVALPTSGAQVNGRLWRPGPASTLVTIAAWSLSKMRGTARSGAESGAVAPVSIRRPARTKS